MARCSKCIVSSRLVRNMSRANLLSKEVSLERPCREHIEGELEQAKESVEVAR